VAKARKNPVVGLVQHGTTANKAENVQKSVAGIHEAARRGATIVCLEELFASPYFCQVEDAALFDLAEPVPGPTTELVAAAAKAAKVTVVSSVFERRAAGVYHNTAVVYGPDGAELSRYRKMHIPDDPQYYEKFYFTPGDLGFVACRTESAVVGTLVCWDQWYPEAARLTALRGAELLCYPTAIGWLPRDKAEYGAAQLAAWQTIQKSHAVANGVFVVAVNRVGVERAADGAEIEFWGRSFVCDPGGTVIAEAGSGEEVLVVECDLSKIEATRRGWPFLRDRRIDAFADLTKRWVD
jgi:N-carbamoylputrescine amidase